MDSKLGWDILTYTYDLSLDEKIKIIETFIDMKEESQPEALLELFAIDFYSDENIRKVLTFFKKQLGPIIICREASLCYQKIITIVDSVLLVENSLDKINCERVLRIMVNEFGFKSSIDVQSNLLLDQYNVDSNYTNTIYINTKPNKKWIHEKNEFQLLLYTIGRSMVNYLYIKIGKNLFDL